MCSCRRMSVLTMMITTILDWQMWKFWRDWLMWQQKKMSGTWLSACILTTFLIFNTDKYSWNKSTHIQIHSLSRIHLDAEHTVNIWNWRYLIHFYSFSINSLSFMCSLSNYIYIIHIYTCVCYPNIYVYMLIW